MTGCATKLTVISPPIDEELRARCTITVEPLTSGDQYDTARALVQAVKSYRDCKAKHDALLNAIDVRDRVIQSVQQQTTQQ